MRLLDIYENGHEPLKVRNAVIKLDAHATKIQIKLNTNESFCTSINKRTNNINKNWWTMLIIM